MYFTDMLTPLIFRLAWVLELHADMSSATTYDSIQLRIYGSIAI